jgi:hypothetical protein
MKTREKSNKDLLCAIIENWALAIVRKVDAPPFRDSMTWVLGYDQGRRPLSIWNPRFLQPF